MRAKKGNVLFLILIAVALFALLSYTVTSSMRGGGDTSRENSSISTSLIAQHHSIVKTAITRVKLINGCSDTQLSFEHTETGTDYVNALAPVNNTCHIFHPNGGNISHIKPPDDILDNTYEASFSYGFYYYFATSIFDVGGTGECLTSDCLELLMAVPYVTLDACLSFNESVGVGTRANNLPPRENNSATTGIILAYVFDGDYTALTAPNFDIDSNGGSNATEDALIDGQPTGCVELSDGAYMIFDSLMIR